MVQPSSAERNLVQGADSETPHCETQSLRSNKTSKGGASKYQSNSINSNNVTAPTIRKALRTNRATTVTVAELNDVSQSMRHGTTKLQMETRKPTGDASDRGARDCFGAPEIRAALQDFGKVSEVARQDRLSASELLSKQLAVKPECDVLVSAAEQLLRAVGAAERADLRVLRQLPGAIVRKSVELSCVAHQPQIQELHHLKVRVQALEQHHIESSCAYLDELVFWRSQARSGEELTFSPTDQYFWDAMAVLPEDLQGLASDVIIEKLKCFVTQSHAITLSELQAQLRRLQQHVAKMEAETEVLVQQLADSRHAGEALETRLNLQKAKCLHMERQQLSSGDAAMRGKACCDESELLSKQMAELHELKLQLASSDTVSLQRDLEKAKGISNAAEMRAAAAEQELQMADLSSLSVRDVAGLSVQDLLQNDFVRLANRLTDSSISAHAGEWLLSACSRLAGLFDEIVEDRDMEKLMRAALQRQLEAAQMKVELHRQQQSNCSEDEEPVSLHSVSADQSRAQTALSSDFPETCGIETAEPFAAESLEVRQAGRRASSPELILRQISAELLSHGSKGEAIKKLEEEIAALHQRHNEDAKLLQERRVLVESTDQQFDVGQNSSCSGAHGTALEQQLAQTLDELADARRSQLHPAQVAELSAELRKARQEVFAGANMNDALQKTVQHLQQELQQQRLQWQQQSQQDLQNDFSPETNLMCVDMRNIKDSCTRKVHNRLHEDAMRRQGRVLAYLEAVQLPRPPAAAHRREQGNQTRMRRSSSAPALVLLSGEVQEMMWENAQHLEEVLAEPLFSTPLAPSADTVKRLSSRRGAPLVPCTPEPPHYCGQDKMQQPHERVGSLVVWKRAPTPCSQAATTAPPSPSPDIPSRPNSRPASASMGAGRPNSAPYSARRACVVKALPCKLQVRETCLQLQPGTPIVAGDTKRALPVQKQSLTAAPSKPTTIEPPQEQEAKSPDVSGERLPGLPPAAALAAARAALAAAGPRSFASVPNGAERDWGHSATMLMGTTRRASLKGQHKAHKRSSA